MTVSIILLSKGFNRSISRLKTSSSLYDLVGYKLRKNTLCISVVTTFFLDKLEII